MSAEDDFLRDVRDHPDDDQCRELVAGELGRQIFQLDLCYTDVGDHGLFCLAGLSELRGLYLGGIRITDVGLEYLARLGRLRLLSLRSTGIGDAGLAHLESLDNLRALDLSLTGVTPDGRSALRRALPRLRLTD